MNHRNTYNGLTAMTQKIFENENSLSEEEMVSLVFLMCDNTGKALRILTENLVGCQEPNKILRNLLKSEDSSDIQYRKFVESLVLIKNYQFIKTLGYSMDDINKFKKEYKKCEKKYYINLVRKSLLTMCESMTCEELAYLMLLIKCDFTKCKKPFEPYNSTQMEIYLLYCIDEGYISDGTGNKKCDVSSLIKHLINMNKHDLAKELEKFHKSGSNSKEENLQRVVYKDNGTFEKCCVLEVTSTNDIHLNGDIYSMNDDNMGLCIIVNQRNFSKANLIKNCGIQMDEHRQGTNYDRDILRTTFTGLGYEVKILENLSGSCLRKSIGDILQQVSENHSSFVMCILSHGRRDAVYGVDGIVVPVDDVENMIVKCPNLLGKPKIIFIQACQGNGFQKALLRINAEDDDCPMLTCDGPSSSVEQKFPPLADLLTYWATVPGYASIRFPYTGSVFIQTLCAELLKRGHKDHLHDIVTYVNHELSEKHFDKDSKVVMPQVRHSFTKKLYFPYSPQKRYEAAKMLFLNHFVEALIQECIVTVSAFKLFKEKSKNHVSQNVMESNHASTP